MATETFIIDVRTRGTKKAAGDVRQIGAAAGSVRKTLAFLRAALVAVAAVRVFGTLTSDIVAFSDEMLVVKAVTSATTAEFQRMRDVAKGLGASTRFTAAEAAEGMAFLARAGFEVGEIIGAIPATLNLAAAAQLDLGRAADIASNLMTSFGLTVADTTDITDVLVFTANNANTTVQQLADGLKLFAPIASQLGITLRDASAAMGILGDAGIQASLAGTGLRRVITDLEAPTGALAKALDFMGVAFEEVRPSSVGLEGALLRLREANVGAAASSLLFGKRGGFVAAELLRSVGDINEFREEMERIEGVARRNAEELESGLGGALRLVRSALQNLIITFGDLGAEEFLNDFFRGLAAALRAIAENAESVVTSFKTLIAVFAVRKILLFTKALLLAGGGMLKLVGGALLVPVALAKATFSVGTFGAALNAIPFVSIITLLGVVLAGFVAFGSEIKLVEGEASTLSDTFSTLGDIMDRELTSAVNSLGFDFQDFGEIVKDVVSGIARGIEDVIAVTFGLVAALRNISTRAALENKQNLLNAKNDLLESQLSANRALNRVGVPDVFNVNETKKEILGLIVEVQKLNKEVADGGTTFTNAFVKGVQSFRDARQATTNARLIAERDAAIIATENANRQAAQARAAAEEAGRAPFVGRTDLAAAAAARRAANEARKAKAEIDRLTEALRNLESQHFPLIAVQNAEAKILKTINDARAKGITLAVNQEELLKRAARAQLGLGISVEQAGEQQQVYKRALDDSLISLEEYKNLTRDLNIELLENTPGALAGMELGLLRVGKTADDVGSQIADAIVGAFDEATDAFLEFVKTGKFSFKSLVDFILIELTRIAFQRSVVSSLSGLFGNILGGISGGAIPAGQPGSTLSAGISTGAIPDFPQFANGGEFQVNPSTSIPFAGPGLDDRLVQFRARRGEDVNITPPGKENKERVKNLTVQQSFIINNPIDPDGFKRSQPQMAARGLIAAERFRNRIGT